MDADELIAAVRALKLEHPAYSAKQVHDALAAAGTATELSQVKKACSKVAKALAQDKKGDSPADDPASFSVGDASAAREKIRAVFENRKPGDPLDLAGLMRLQKGADGHEYPMHPDTFKAIFRSVFSEARHGAEVTDGELELLFNAMDQNTVENQFYYNIEISNN